MIVFKVNNPIKSYSDYIFMYQRAKGSSKGSLKMGKEELIEYLKNDTSLIK